jgi:hypothetical protein
MAPRSFTHSTWDSLEPRDLPSLHRRPGNIVQVSARRKITNVGEQETSACCSIEWERPKPFWNCFPANEYFPGADTKLMNIQTAWQIGKSVLAFHQWWNGGSQRWHWSSPRHEVTDRKQCTWQLLDLICRLLISARTCVPGCSMVRMETAPPSVRPTVSPWALCCSPTRAPSWARGLQGRFAYVSLRTGM